MAGIWSRATVAGGPPSKEADAYPAMPEDGYGWEKLFSERKGILAITDSAILEPLNLGSDELTTIEGLYDMVEEIAGVKLKHTHNLTAPKGVNGRNSDNTKIQEYLGWAPGIRLRDGMKKTYDWIYGEYQKKYAGQPA